MTDLFDQWFSELLLGVQVSQRMIDMDSKAQLTVDVISKVAEGKIDIVNAAKLLKKYRKTGI